LTEQEKAALDMRQLCGGALARFRVGSPALLEIRQDFQLKTERADPRLRALSQLSCRAIARL